jgi:hypothetical protein
MYGAIGLNLNGCAISTFHVADALPAVIAGSTAAEGAWHAASEHFPFISRIGKTSVAKLTVQLASGTHAPPEDEPDDPEADDEDASPDPVAPTPPTTLAGSPY